MMELDRDQTTWKKAFVPHVYVALVEIEGQGDVGRKELRHDRIERLGKIFYAGVAPSMEDDVTRELQQKDSDELEAVTPTETGPVVMDEPLIEVPPAITPPDGQEAKVADRFKAPEDDMDDDSAFGSSDFADVDVRDLSLKAPQY